MQSTSSHVLRRSIRSLWENLSLNGMVAGVIAAALLLAGAYLQVLINLDRMMGTWDRDVHISAYFYSDVPEDRRFSIKDDLAKLQEVENILYISEGEAGAYLVDKVPDVKPILDEFGPEVLPASLEITLRSAFTTPTEIEAFVDRIQSFDFEEIDYGQEWVQRFESFVSLIQTLGVVIGLLIATAAIFLVANTMHLVVYARRSELETMKLVGATFAFVSSPFLLEGAILGMVGASIATLGMLALHNLLLLRLETYLQLAIGNESLVFLPIGAIVALFLIGMLLGMAGCLTAVRRFWKAAS
ncbi:MAG: permease-like cell division protein FtsX [Myxococcota bacterium]|nr:permease-like cell division protein FtsX [Myxococcota bacterium]